MKRQQLISWPNHLWELQTYTVLGHVTRSIVRWIREQIPQPVDSRVWPTSHRVRNSLTANIRDNSAYYPPRKQKS